MQTKSNTEEDFVRFAAALESLDIQDDKAFRGALRGTINTFQIKPMQLARATKVNVWDILRWELPTSDLPDSTVRKEVITRIQGYLYRLSSI